MAKRQKGPLSDKEVETLLQRFVSGGMRLDEGEQVIERFRLSRAQVLPRLLRMISDPDESTHLVAAQLLIALEDRQVVRPLLGLLDDPALSDASKLSIFGVLQHFHAPVDLESLYRRLRDPEALASRSQENLLRSFTRAPELAQFLDSLAQYLPLKERQGTIRRLAEIGDPRALYPLRAALHMPEETVVLAAIEGLNTLRAVVAIPWLEELARYGPTAMIRQEAGKVAGHLTMRSSVPGAGVIGDLPALAGIRWPLHSCWLTIIDGAGGQLAFVARERPESCLAIVDIMFTDHEGLKDCFGAEMMPQREFEELLNDLASGGITAVQVSLERCRAVVEKAYGRALAVGRQLPIEYFAWVELLAGEDPRSVEERPVEEVDIGANPELLARSIGLLGLDEMASWFFNADEIQAFADRHRRLLWWPVMPTSRMVHLLRQGVRSIVDSERRALLCDRLRCQAWLLAQIYENEEVWQWAMAAAAGLGMNGVPSDQHPLLLGMVAASLDNLLGTELLAEILAWETGVWIDIMKRATAPPVVPPRAQSEWSKLRAFLQAADLEIPTGLSALISMDEPRSVIGESDRAQAALRGLNWLESIFDEEAEDQLYEAEGIDWRRLREELGLIPVAGVKSPVLEGIQEEFVGQMEREACSPVMISRARQLWDDYILLTAGQIGPLRKPESWAAGMEYLVHLLYFDWRTQAEAGAPHEVSAATVSKRYRALREELGVQVFSHPFDKDFQAMERLRIWDEHRPEELVQRMSGRITEPGKLSPPQDQDRE
jgi:hypothetical protein